MGCFDVTCGLTNTGISRGEKCIAIVFNPLPEYIVFSFYNLSGQTWRQSCRNSQELSDVEMELCDSGDFKIGHFLPIKDIVVGDYNEYGGVCDENNEDICLYDMDVNNLQMYHVWAIEFLFGKPINELLVDKIQFASDFYQKLFCLRKSPNDSICIGEQHKSVKEMKTMVSMNNRINEYLEFKIKEYESE